MHIYLTRSSYNSYRKLFTNFIEFFYSYFSLSIHLFFKDVILISLGNKSPLEIRSYQPQLQTHFVRFLERLEEKVAVKKRGRKI